jgi:tetratricopeptide (TPR) repeat protein
MLQTATEAIKRGLDDEGVFSYFAGLVALETKNFVKAGPWFQESIKINPNQAESYEALGKILMLLGENQKATALLNTAEKQKKEKKVFKFTANQLGARIF